jgi:hypothetical protein
MWERVVEALKRSGMHVVLEGVEWWCTRNTVMNLQSPQKTGIK